jgi:hypothetical protein
LLIVFLDQLISFGNVHLMVMDNHLNTIEQF